MLDQRLGYSIEALLFGFDKWLVLTGKGSYNVVSLAKQNGWMSEKYADLFTDYCIKDWRVI